MKRIRKSIEISDAKISFVSLVGKAANKKQFLITKEEEGKARFMSYGKIVKVDSDNHYLTGIVYEPMVKDAHDNFMTADEIQKAAYWYAKNGDKVDLQHSFEAMSSAFVVENWVEKADTVIEGQEISKGTWLMTVEISDSDVWESVVKGDISGFSMGGVGVYDSEDIDLATIEKTDGIASKEEKQGLLSKLSKALGLDSLDKQGEVTKGELADEYALRKKSSNFWSAMNILENLLRTEHWDSREDRYVYNFESDSTKIKEALKDFSVIITDILGMDDIAKMLELEAPSSVQKAGKKISNSNKEKLENVYQAFTEFKSVFDEVEKEVGEEEEVVMKETEMNQIAKMIELAVEKAVSVSKGEPVEDVVVKDTKEENTITQEVLEKMIQKAVDEALSEESGDVVVEKSVTLDTVQDMIQKSLAAVLKSRGVASNLNDEVNVQKNEEAHYMTGIL